MSELAAGVIGAAYGTIAAYLLDLRKSAAERRHVALEAERLLRERRSSLATALLVDLRTVETTLRQMFRAKHPSGAGSIIPALFLERVEHEIVIFSAKTITKVFGVYTSTRDFFALLGDATTAADDKFKPAQIDYALRCKAAFALQALPDAVAALVAEGGVMPEERRVGHVISPVLPAIPDRIFPRVLDGGDSKLEEMIE